MSLKQEIKDLHDDISDIRNKANIKEQGNAMKALLAEVSEFVSAIDEEKKLVGKITELRRKVSAEPTSPDEEQDYADAMKALREAEALKSELSQKKTMLRRVLTDVKALEYAIQRCLR